MRLSRLFLLPLTVILLASCSKDFNVNADWKEIPVVYCLLNQNDSVHFIKVTKAFLGEGDAMMYAEIPDSSNYPVGDLQVMIEEWNGSTYLRTLTFHDTLVQNKDTGIFYAPTQLVYTSGGTLNEAYLYKLKITNLKKNFDITSQTTLIKEFDIEKPQGFPAQVSFMPGKKTELKWKPAEGGKRYQVLVKFHYYETTNGVTEEKILDWPVVSSITADANDPTISRSISGESFYGYLHAKLTPGGDSITRAALNCEFIFTVGSPDLNTYMEVTEPSNTIIQERPSFTNITNGIGLFTSRFDNTKFHSIVCDVNDATKQELKVNELTRDLNF